MSEILCYFIDSPPLGQESVDWKLERQAFDAVLEVSKQEENRKGLPLLELIKRAAQRPHKDSQQFEEATGRAAWFLLSDGILSRTPEDLVVYRSIDQHS